MRARNGGCNGGCGSGSSLTILSVLHVKKRFPIRYDSANGNQFVVVKPDKEIIFNESKEGLYYHDTANRAVVMVNTVK
jgi:hypothetical protein